MSEQTANLCALKCLAEGDNVIICAYTHGYGRYCGYINKIKVENLNDGKRGSDN